MARYGARAMMELAGAPEGVPVTLGHIARRQDLSRGYLEQIMIQLRSRGLVRSVRGAGGGFALTRSPSDITLAEVVETLEGQICVVKCTEEPSVCDRSSYCATRDVWSSLAKLIHDRLNGITLAELAARQATKIAATASTYSI